MESWNPFFFFLISVILSADSAKKLSSAQPKVFPSPQKPLPAPNPFPPDADTNPRGAVGAALLNCLDIFSSPLLIRPIS
jgi:hypothetical protein